MNVPLSVSTARDPDVDLICYLRQTSYKNERLVAKGVLSLKKWFLKNDFTEAVNYESVRIGLIREQTQDKKKILRRNRSQTRTNQRKKTNKSKYVGFVECDLVATRTEPGIIKHSVSKHIQQPNEATFGDKINIKANETPVSKKNHANSVKKSYLGLKIGAVEEDLVQVLETQTSTGNFHYLEISPLIPNTGPISERFLIKSQSQTLANTNFYKIIPFSSPLNDESLGEREFLLAKLIGKSKSGERTLIGFAKLLLTGAEEGDIAEGQERRLFKTESRRAEVLDTKGNILGFLKYLLEFGRYEQLVRSQSNLPELEKPKMNNEPAPEIQMLECQYSRFPDFDPKYAKVGHLPFDLKYQVNPGITNSAKATEEDITKDKVKYETHVDKGMQVYSKFGENSWLLQQNGEDNTKLNTRDCQSQLTEKETGEDYLLRKQMQLPKFGNLENLLYPNKASDRTHTGRSILKASKRFSGSVSKSKYICNKNFCRGECRDIRMKIR